MLAAENQNRKKKKNTLKKYLFCVKCFFLLTLTLEKTKFIPSCEAFFLDDSACAILFETQKRKVVKILLFNFKKQKCQQKYMPHIFAETKLSHLRKISDYFFHT